MNSVAINRAPVLTLWAAVVGRHLGFDEDEGLTLGKALAGLNAQAKGRRLGRFKPHEEKPKKARQKERGRRFWIEVLVRPVPATDADGRAGRRRRPAGPGRAAFRAAHRRRSAADAVSGAGGRPRAATLLLRRGSRLRLRPAPLWPVLHAGEVQVQFGAVRERR